MATVYDQTYQTENYFGKPYPELIAFFKSYPHKGTVLDLGCGQGRNAIPLARLGYEVVGVDISEVGIKQMSNVAKQEQIQLTGFVADIFKFDDFANYDIILLDSMFHFLKKDLQRETDLVRHIINTMNPGSIVMFCIQDTAKKVQILNEAIDDKEPLYRLIEQSLQYSFEDKQTGHKSTSNYQMIVVRK